VIKRAFRMTRILTFIAASIGMGLSPTKFASLDWIDQLDEMGIIAGGMSDGAITLWNVKKLLENNNQQLTMGKGCISAA
jgi:hypothetical protein